MKIVKLNVDVYIPDNIGSDVGAVISYLNNMLNYKPEFFGQLTRENIVEITSDDGDLIYHAN